MSIRKPPISESRLEIFSALFADIATRDIQDAMEVPFLSLSKKPRFQPITYTSKGLEVTVTGGSPYGIANIWDWDLIMWLLSQIRQALDQGQSASRKIRFHRHAFLKEARRDTGGTQYRRLEDAIARLKNTNVVTTIRAKTGRTVMFSWLESVSIERDNKGRLQDATVVIPEWLYEAVSDGRLVLSLHPDYFLLTGGIERWLYRFIRKQAGNRATGWRWKFHTLHARSGSTQRYSDFAISLREIAGKGRLLDYMLQISKEKGQEYLYARSTNKQQKSTEIVSESPKPHFLSLKTSTYEKAKVLAPGYDIYALESDWREATQKNGVLLRDPDAAFLAWCKKISQKQPIAF